MVTVAFESHLSQPGAFSSSSSPARFLHSVDFSLMFSQVALGDSLSCTSLVPAPSRAIISLFTTVHVHVFLPIGSGDIPMCLSIFVTQGLVLQGFLLKEAMHAYLAP